MSVRIATRSARIVPLLVILLFSTAGIIASFLTTRLGYTPTSTHVEMPTTITGAVRIPLVLSNGTTIYVEASYVCELDGNCTYVFDVPNITSGYDYVLRTHGSKVVVLDRDLIECDEFSFVDADGRELPYFIAGKLVFVRTNGVEEVTIVCSAGQPSSSVFDFFEDFNWNYEKSGKGGTSFDVHGWRFGAVNRGSYNDIEWKISANGALELRIHDAVDEDVGEYIYLEKDGVAASAPFVVVFRARYDYYREHYDIGWSSVDLVGSDGKSGIGVPLIGWDAGFKLSVCVSGSCTRKYIHVSTSFARSFHTYVLYVSSNRVCLYIDDETTCIDRSVTINKIRIATGTYEHQTNNIVVDYIALATDVYFVNKNDIEKVYRQAVATVTIGGRTWTITLDGTTKTISYTPNITIPISIDANQAVVSPPSNGKLVYRGQEYATSITITPEQAWENNVVYAVSTDELNMYYVSAKIPVVKYVVYPSSFEGTQASLKANFTFTYEAKDVNRVLPITVYNVSAKLRPGVNVVEPSYSIGTNDYLVLVEKRPLVINVAGQLQVHFIPRQAVSKNPYLTGSVVLTNTGNATLSSLVLHVELRSPSIRYANDFPLSITLRPGYSTTIVLDDYRIPLPDVGVYYLRLSIRYDPDGTVYELTNVEQRVVAGYVLEIYSAKPCQVVLEKLDGSDRVVDTVEVRKEVVVLPGSYKLIAEASDGTRIEKVINVNSDTQIFLDWSRASAPSTVSPATLSRSYTKYIIAIAAIILLILLFVATSGSRKRNWVSFI